MDRETFDDFVRGRSIVLGRTAYLLTRNAHDAEDLVQTALARAATRWSRIDNPEAYVRRMLHLGGRFRGVNCAGCRPRYSATPSTPMPRSRPPRWRPGWSSSRRWAD